MAVLITDLGLISILVMRYYSLNYNYMFDT